MRSPGVIVLSVAILGTLHASPATAGNGRASAASKWMNKEAFGAFKGKDTTHLGRLPFTRDRSSALGSTTSEVHVSLTRHGQNLRMRTDEALTGSFVIEGRIVKEEAKKDGSVTLRVKSEGPDHRRNVNRFSRKAPLARLLGIRTTAKDARAVHTFTFRPDGTVGVTGERAWTVKRVRSTNARGLLFAPIARLVAGRGNFESVEQELAPVPSASSKSGPVDPQAPPGPK